MEVHQQARWVGHRGHGLALLDSTVYHHGLHEGQRRDPMKVKLPGCVGVHCIPLCCTSMQIILCTFHPSPPPHAATVTGVFDSTCRDPRDIVHTHCTLANIWLMPGLQEKKPRSDSFKV